MTDGSGLSPHLHAPRLQCPCHSNTDSGHVRNPAPHPLIHVIQHDPKAVHTKLPNPPKQARPSLTCATVKPGDAGWNRSHSFSDELAIEPILPHRYLSPIGRCAKPTCARRARAATGSRPLTGCSAVAESCVTRAVLALLIAYGSCERRGNVRRDPLQEIVALFREEQRSEVGDVSAGDGEHRGCWSSGRHAARYARHADLYRMGGGKGTSSTASVGHGRRMRLLPIACSYASALVDKLSPAHARSIESPASA